MISNIPKLQQDIISAVRTALTEDVGNGDITAGLIPAERQAKAHVITREDCVICGQAWVNEVFRQIDDNVSVEWCVKDGDSVSANTRLFRLSGNARSLLAGERTALNFLQFLSGTATTCRAFADLVEGTGVKLLDTRKTIPGLRTAQKYAVTCGGFYNHRIGLFDAFLIKENHISACGGIAEAVSAARLQAPGKSVEVEVENLEGLHEALAAEANIVMLDNFSLESIREAVGINAGKAKLEVSGGITQKTLLAIAELGPEFISVGAPTKNVTAIDLSFCLNL